MKCIIYQLEKVIAGGARQIAVSASREKREVENSGSSDLLTSDDDSLFLRVGRVRPVEFSRHLVRRIDHDALRRHVGTGP